MDHLSCMRVFVRVVEHGAFARAAEDLRLSRASVTTAVARLERRLGVRLLQRTTRRLSLTDEGRLYYADCVRILAELDEAEDSLSGARSAPRGRLRVSIPQSFAALGFFPIVQDFMQRHPQLAVEVIVTDRAVNLVEEGFDCALRGATVAPDALLVARTLFVTRLVTCAAPTYLAAHGTPRDFADLAGHECVRFVSPSTGRMSAWQFEQDGQHLTHEPGGRLWVNSLDAVVAAAAAGAGLAQVPDVLVREALGAGRLQAVLTDLTAPGLPLLIVYPANRYLPAKVRAFAAHLEEAYPRGGWWPEIAQGLGTETMR